MFRAREAGESSGDHERRVPRVPGPPALCQVISPQSSPRRQIVRRLPAARHRNGLKSAKNQGLFRARLYGHVGRGRAAARVPPTLAPLVIPRCTFLPTPSTRGSSLLIASTFPGRPGGGGGGGLAPRSPEASVLEPTATFSLSLVGLQPVLKPASRSGDAAWSARWSSDGRAPSDPHGQLVRVASRLRPQRVRCPGLGWPALWHLRKGPGICC